MKAQNTTDPEQPSIGQFSTNTRTQVIRQFDKVSVAIMLSHLRLGWQSRSAYRTWYALAEQILVHIHRQPFSAASWIAANLNLLHPPLPERDTPRLLSLSVKELKELYHTLSTSASPEWQDYVWDTFTEMLERELALEL